MKPALVILAAGASERLGRCKALVSLAGRHPLERLLEAGAGCDQAPPLVVTGADDAAIRAAAPPGCELLFNPRWREGRTGGVRLARARRPERDLLLAPVDVPLVPAAVFTRLCEAWSEAGCPAQGWLAPAVRVSRAGGSGAGPERAFGHPIVVGRALLGLLEGFEPSDPLRGLRARAAPLLAVDVSAPEILDDLDRPEDLERLQRRAGPP